MFRANRFITIQNWPPKTCCFLTTQGKIYAPSNRFNTGDKLIIASLVTKDVYIRPYISLIRYHIQMYMSSLFTSTLVVGNAVFWIKIGGWKGSCFDMTNIRALSTLTIHSNISKIRVLIKIALCRNARMQVHLPKNSQLLCQYKMTSWHYIVIKSSIIDYMGVLDPLLVCRFLSETLQKRLKFNEVDIYMLKVKKRGTRARCEIFLKLTINAPKRS